MPVEPPWKSAAPVSEPDPTSPHEEPVPRVPPEIEPPVRQAPEIEPPSREPPMTEPGRQFEPESTPPGIHQPPDPDQQLPGAPPMVIA